MSGPRPARPKRVASISGDEATCYVEEQESGWRATYDDAPIGILQDAEQASRFACDIARMQAQIGRVTWVIVLAEVDEVHRFEPRVDSIHTSISHEALRPSAAGPIPLTKSRQWFPSWAIYRGRQNPPRITGNTRAGRHADPPAW
jgi:hypothetical protein